LIFQGSSRFAQSGNELPGHASAGGTVVTSGTASAAGTGNVDIAGHASAAAAAAGTVVTSGTASVAGTGNVDIVGHASAVATAAGTVMGSAAGSGSASVAGAGNAAVNLGKHLLFSKVSNLATKCLHYCNFTSYFQKFSIKLPIFYSVLRLDATRKRGA
jgi:hypothetical protein